MHNKRVKVDIFPSMHVVPAASHGAPFEDSARTYGLNQRDNPNKLQCSLGHLFPDEAVVTWPLIKHSECVCVCACVCVCVGGLFTFH